MKKTILIVSIVVLIAGLMQCRNKNKTKLQGIWQLNAMQINGTVIPGSSLGRWLWEFNDDGGYLIDIDGRREKGFYELNDTTITLKPITLPKRPERTYGIAKLDSVELDLVSVGEKNMSTMRLIKIKSDDLGEKD